MKTLRLTAYILVGLLAMGLAVWGLGALLGALGLTGGHGPGHDGGMRPGGGMPPGGMPPGGEGMGRGDRHGGSGLGQLLPEVGSMVLTLGVGVALWFGGRWLLSRRTRTA